MSVIAAVAGVLVFGGAWMAITSWKPVAVDGGSAGLRAVWRVHRARITGASACALLALVVTRWPVAAIAGGGLGWALSGRSGRRRRVEFWSIAVDAVSYRWPHIGRILKAQPKLLIDDGVLNRRVMRREFMTDDEVMSILRTQGIESVDVVRRARIEPNGQVSVLRRDGAQTQAPEPPAAL